MVHSLNKLPRTVFVSDIMVKKWLRKLQSQTHITSLRLPHSRQNWAFDVHTCIKILQWCVPALPSCEQIEGVCAFLNECKVVYYYICALATHTPAFRSNFSGRAHFIMTRRRQFHFAKDDCSAWLILPSDIPQKRKACVNALGWDQLIVTHHETHNTQMKLVLRLEPIHA